MLVAMGFDKLHDPSLQLQSAFFDKKYSAAIISPQVTKSLLLMSFSIGLIGVLIFP